MDQPSHIRGYLGEQTMGFFLGAQGYFFVEGPGGSAGHGVTTSGFDGIAFNPKTGHLIIYDNKAYSRTGNVAGATAIDKSRNLGQNIDKLIQRVQGMTFLPSRIQILDLLRGTRVAVQSGQKIPGNVQIAVSNAAGRSTGVSGRLSANGIQFIDVNVPIQQPPVRSTRRYLSALMSMGGLLGDFAEWLGDKGIERRIDARLQELAPKISAILAEGDGVLVVIHLQEWARPDFQGRRARMFLGLYIQRGVTPKSATDAWNLVPRMYQGPSAGWQIVVRYKWIAP